MSRTNQKYYKKFDIDISLSDKNLQKILKFYLIECPVPNVSNRGQTFKDFGFGGSPAFSRLKARLLNNASPSLKANYLPCKKEELNDSFLLVEALSPPEEYCVFLKHEVYTVLGSLFVAIRNAIAHGSFNVRKYHGETIYFFLNYNNYKKAQIVLRETTLLAWIRIIKEGNIMPNQHT